MIIITEEAVDDDGKNISETMKRAGGIIAETVEDDCAGTIAETVEDAGAGMTAETIEETIEENPGLKGTIASGTQRRRRFRLDIRKIRQRRVSGMKVQGDQWKRMTGWLVPYLAVLLLIMLTGGVILLVTGAKTDYLAQQIQEQYGEYFTDGQ